MGPVGFWASKRDQQEAARRAPLATADAERLRHEIAALGDLAAEFSRRVAVLEGLLAPMLSPVPAAPVDAVPQDRTAGHRSTGRVKWFNAEKGFGFITPDEPGPDLFAHDSQIERPGPRELADGQRVEFETVKGAKGPQADHIRILAEQL